MDKGWTNILQRHRGQKNIEDQQLAGYSIPK